MIFLLVCGLLAGVVGAGTFVLSDTPFGQIMGVLIIGFGAMYLGLAMVVHVVTRLLAASIRHAESNHVIANAIELHHRKISKFLDRWPEEPAK